MKAVILAGGNLSSESFNHILTSYKQCDIKNVFITNFLSELPMPEFEHSPDINLIYCYSLPALLAMTDIHFDQSGVFVLGGDQFKLQEYNIATVRTFLAQFRVIGGTSAGAMIMGKEYYGFPNEEKPIFETGEGLGFVDFYVDTHTFERGRISRMQHFPGMVVGVNEDSFISITVNERLDEQEMYIESMNPEILFQTNE